jgi:tetratricopeptide (TPR) repeat protein
MSNASKAVFLSYASQDAEAAQRICAALRAAEVEVWFDQNELRGGDSWDQKIRRQIKECALFLPVISASTQARREGYFRLEWKLADDRTHLMAKGTPFLVPVCVDDTKDWDAIVPDSFMAVQWTRFAGGETPNAFCERVRSLLAGAPALEPGRSRPAERGEGAASPTNRRVGRRVPAAAWVAATVVLAIALGIAWQRWTKPAPAANAGAGIHSLRSGQAYSPPNTTEKAALWPSDLELRRAVTMLSATEANSEDFALAEEIVKKTLVKNSTDPEAVTVMARVQVSYLFRGFDRSDERRATARRYAERAVQLAPNEPEALAALGVFHFQRGGNADLARELLNKAIRLRPDEPYYYRHRDNALFIDPRVSAAEAIASAEKTAERFPRDALAQYELARHYRNLGRIDDCERAIDRTLAIEPIANAIGWKARIALNVRGDFAEMKALLERIPPRMRSIERVVISRWIYSMAGTDREDGIEALQSLTNPWIEDFYYVGPKSLLMAALLEASGKRESARLHFEAALTETRDRQARAPANLSLRNIETCALLGLGRIDEARAANRVVMESVRRPYRYDPFDTWWFSSIPRCLLLGDRETAIELLREAAGGATASPSGRIPTGESRVSGRAAVRMAMRQDTRMAPFRYDPEIAALLAEPKKDTMIAPPSEAGQLAARALALFTKIGFTRDDLAPAEDFARRATDKEPDNAAAWGVRAGVQSAWIFRNWDFSEKRRQDAQTFANRALSLDPNEPEALLALAHVLRAQGAADQAEAHVRRSLAANPSHIRLARALGSMLAMSGRTAEARTVLLEIAQRAPRDPLVRYELAMSYADFGPGGADPKNLVSSLEQLDTAIGIQPFASALIAKAVLIGGWRGDLPAMRAMLEQLDKLSLSDRSEDRSVCVAMWAGLLERRPERVEAAAALTARTYFEDLILPLHPKAWSLALAHRLAGKENLARQDWQAAEGVMRQRLKDDPSSAAYQVELAATLAQLGQREEAARLVDPVEPVWREESNRGRLRLLALYYGAAGDAAKAAPYLAASIDRGVFMSRKVVRLDPWWDKLRGQPEFEALLKEPGK